jgi:hypothetical protein
MRGARAVLATGTAPAVSFGWLVDRAGASRWISRLGDPYARFADRALVAGWAATIPTMRNGSTSPAWW